MLTCDKQEGVRTVEGLQGGPSCEKGLQCSTRAEHMAGTVCCVVARSRSSPLPLLLVGQYQGCEGCRAGGNSLWDEVLGIELLQRLGAHPTCHHGHMIDSAGGHLWRGSTWELSAADEWLVAKCAGQYSAGRTRAEPLPSWRLPRLRSSP